MPSVNWKRKKRNTYRRRSKTSVFSEITEASPLRMPRRIIAVAAER